MPKICSGNFNEDTLRKIKDKVAMAVFVLRAPVPFVVARTLLRNQGTASGTPKATRHRKATVLRTRGPISA